MMDVGFGALAQAANQSWERTVNMDNDGIDISAQAAGSG